MVRLVPGYRWFRRVRRHAGTIAAFAVVGSVAGWITGPAPGDTFGRLWQGTSTLLEVPSASPGLNLDQVAIMAVAGNVPTRAVVALGGSGDVRVAVRLAVAFAQPEVSTVSIHVSHPDRETARRIADVLGDELLVEVATIAEQALADMVAQAQARVVTAQTQADTLQARVATFPVGVDLTSAERNAVQRLEDAQAEVIDADIGARAHPGGGVRATASRRCGREPSPSPARATPHPTHGATGRSSWASSARRSVSSSPTSPPDATGGFVTGSASSGSPGSLRWSRSRSPEPSGDVR